MHFHSNQIKSTLSYWSNTNSKFMLMWPLWMTPPLQNLIPTHHHVVNIHETCWSSYTHKIWINERRILIKTICFPLQEDIKLQTYRIKIFFISYKRVGWLTSGIFREICSLFNWLAGLKPVHNLPPLNSTCISENMLYYYF